MSDSRQNDRRLSCGEIEPLAVLRACGELDAATLAALEEHLATCPDCAATASRESRLQRAIASLDQPADSLDRSGLLLAQCRSELAEALDDRQSRAGRSAWRAIVSPAAWWALLRDTLIYHPAMSMAVLVVAGFLAGVAGQRLRLPPLKFLPPPAVALSPTPASQPNAPGSNNTGVTVASRITDEQLRSADNARVAWVSPSGSRTPTVEIELMAPTPTILIGAPDDADVQRALTFVLENGQRFDPGARLDSLDVLRTSAANPVVRQALCAAARLDRDPGVRVKALEALRGFEEDPAVREALLDALGSDANSGVRVEAIHLLVDALGSEGASFAPDPQTADVLRDRLRNDPSRTVRQLSAQALRQLGEQ